MTPLGKVAILRNSSPGRAAALARDCWLGRHGPRRGPGAGRVRLAGARRSKPGSRTGGHSAQEQFSHRQMRLGQSAWVHPIVSPGLDPDVGSATLAAADPRAVIDELRGLTSA